MSFYRDQWSDDQLKQIWEKGRIVPGFNENKYRKDIAGAWIEYSKYGDTKNEAGFGWEVDHRVPKSKGGGDELSNLRPLQWANNRSKGDGYPEWTSVVSSDGGKNANKTQRWTIE